MGSEWAEHQCLGLVPDEEHLNCLEMACPALLHWKQKTDGVCPTNRHRPEKRCDPHSKRPFRGLLRGSMTAKEQVESKGQRSLKKGFWSPFASIVQL